MKVAGFGFRTDTTPAALQDALARAGGTHGLTGLATADDKAGAAALRALATLLHLPILAIPSERLAVQTTLTHSPRVKTRYGTGSLAEAAALAAAGPGARLLAPRAQSQDGTATAAIAERTSP
jgi:cobalt-precorrin 5A hydrolase